MRNYILLGILITLLNKGRQTAKQLAEKYEISTKTVYRYLSFLDCAGIPTISYMGKNGGIEIASTFKLNTTVFTKKEIARIWNALDSTRPLNETIDDDIKQKLNYSAIKEPNSVQQLSQQFFIDSTPWGTFYHENLKLKHIKESIETQQEIEISYQKRNALTETRTIQPYALILKDAIWYVYAFCLQRNEFRLFRVSRIQSYHILKTTFERKNISLSPDLWNTSLQNDTPTILLNISFSSDVKAEIIDWLGEENLSSPTTASANVLFNEGLLHKLLLLGRHVKVISPVTVRDALINEAKNIIQNNSI